MKSMILMSFVCVFWMSTSTFANPINENRNRGVILSERVNLREGFDTKAKVIEKMKRGVTFLILEKTKERYNINPVRVETSPDQVAYYWYKVKTNQGKVGWIFGKFCAINVVSDFYQGQSFQSFKKFNDVIQDTDGDGDKEHIWFAVIDNGEVVTDKGLTGITVHATLVVSHSKAKNEIVCKKDVLLFLDSAQESQKILGIRATQGKKAKDIRIKVEREVIYQAGKVTETITLEKQEGEFAVLSVKRFKVVKGNPVKGK